MIQFEMRNQAVNKLAQFKLILLRTAHIDQFLKHYKIYKLQ